MLHHHDPKVASAFVAGVLPAIRQAVQGAGESLAIEFADGERVNIRHRTQAQQALMFLLADFLLDSINTHDEDHLYPPLSPAELADHDYARQWVADLVDDDDDEPVYTVADLNAAIDEDEAEQTVTPVTPVAEKPARLIGTPVPKFMVPMDERDAVDDADALVEYAILPLITEKLDELSDRMAQSHAPIHIIDAEKNLTSYDLETGRKTARRALWESILAWMQNDKAADGQWVGVILS